MGTKTGGQNAAKTNKARYGKDFYKRIGQKGGQVKGRKGFALMDREQVSLYGSIGGSISKRSYRTK